MDLQHTRMEWEICARQQALLMQTLAARSDRCSAGDLVRVLAAAARASHRSSAVEQLAASQALVQCLPSLLPHTLGKLLWALAKLDCRPPGLLAQLPAAMAVIGKAPSPSSHQWDGKAPCYTAQTKLSHA